jgi:hypothetical protein
MFFQHLEALFPQPAWMGMAPQSRAPLSKSLKVHAVGEFDASFVPGVDDFERLDPRLRLAPSVFDRLPTYRAFSFCVFKLRHARGVVDRMLGRNPAADVHPMAFEFPRRDADALFFPTVHIHDGEVHETAAFDHTLFAQVDVPWVPMFDWAPNMLDTKFLSDATAVCVDRTAPLYRRRLLGSLRNADTVVSGRDLAERHRFGATFRLRMQRAWPDAVPGAAGLDPNVARWIRLTDDERVRVRDRVFDTMKAETEAHASEWGLAPFDARLPVAHATPEPVKGACVVAIHASTERIEPQECTLAFQAVPSVEVVMAVQVAFQRALNRALDG